ncbi:MAG: hypothetical protein SGILL_004052 [Bacillariaceae sp.]
MSGVLTDEIKVFESMESFMIGNNAVGGNIPGVLPSLTSLKTFDIEINNFAGPAVVDLSGTQLESYRVSANRLAGTIPESVMEVTTLKELWMADNQVEGSIPASIGQLTNLETLYLYRNAITGPIPTETGLLGLSELQVFQNFLSGPVPEELYQNTDLDLLRLDRNGLSGSISESIGDLSNLGDLRIDENLFSGTLPASFINLSSLVVLRVNDNQFTGTIRDGFDQWSSLDFADFRNNLFARTLPSTMFDIPSIRILYFANNVLEGPIPANYGNPPVLRDLFLSGNSLTGSIPEIQVGQLTELTEMLLENNLFTGTMAESVCNLRMEGQGMLDDLWHSIATTNMAQQPQRPGGAVQRGQRPRSVFFQDESRERFGAGNGPRPRNTSFPPRRGILGAWSKSQNPNNNNGVTVASGDGDQVMLQRQKPQTQMYRQPQRMHQHQEQQQQEQQQKPEVVAGVNFTEVLHNIQVLEHQQKVSQMKLEHAKTTKQDEIQKQKQNNKLLGEKKFANGQTRGEYDDRIKSLKDAQREAKERRDLSSMLDDGLNAFQQCLERNCDDSRIIDVIVYYIDLTFKAMEQKLNSLSGVTEESISLYESQKKSYDVLKESDETKRKRLDDVRSHIDHLNEAMKTAAPETTKVALDMNETSSKEEEAKVEVQTLNDGIKAMQEQDEKMQEVHKTEMNAYEREEDSIRKELEALNASIVEVTGLLEKEKKDIVDLLQQEGWSLEFEAALDPETLAPVVKETEKSLETKLVADVEKILSLEKEIEEMEQVAEMLEQESLKTEEEADALRLRQIAEEESAEKEKEEIAAVKAQIETETSESVNLEEAHRDLQNELESQKLEHTAAAEVEIAKKDELQRRLESVEDQSKQLDRKLRGEDEHWDDIEKGGLNDRLALAQKELDKAQEAFNIKEEKKHLLKTKEKAVKKQINKIEKSDVIVVITSIRKEHPQLKELETRYNPAESPQRQISRILADLTQKCEAHKIAAEAKESRSKEPEGLATDSEDVNPSKKRDFRFYRAAQYPQGYVPQPEAFDLEPKALFQNDGESTYVALGLPNNRRPSAPTQATSATSYDKRVHWKDDEDDEEDDPIESVELFKENKDKPTDLFSKERDDEPVDLLRKEEDDELVDLFSNEKDDESFDIFQEMDDASGTLHPAQKRSDGGKSKAKPLKSRSIKAQSKPSTKAVKKQSKNQLSQQIAKTAPAEKLQPRRRRRKNATSADSTSGLSALTDQHKGATGRRVLEDITHHDKSRKRGQKKAGSSHDFDNLVKEPKPRKRTQQDASIEVVDRRKVKEDRKSKDKAGVKEDKQLKPRNRAELDFNVKVADRRKVKEAQKTKTKTMNKKVNEITEKGKVSKERDVDRRSSKTTKTAAEKAKTKSSSHDKTVAKEKTSTKSSLADKDKIPGKEKKALKPSLKSSLVTRDKVSIKDKASSQSLLVRRDKTAGKEKVSKSSRVDRDKKADKSSRPSLKAKHASLKDQGRKEKSSRVDRKRKDSDPDRKNDERRKRLKTKSSKADDVSRASKSSKGSRRSRKKAGGATKAPLMSQTFGMDDDLGFTF